MCKRGIPSNQQKQSWRGWSEAVQDDVDSIAKLHQIVALCQRLQIHTIARRIGTEKQAQPAEQRLEKREWSWINRGNDKIMNY